MTIKVKFNLITWEFYDKNFTLLYTNFNVFEVGFLHFREKGLIRF